MAVSAATGRPDVPVTYSKDVAPILRENCQSCHRPGDIAPMSLLTYPEVRPWSKAIRQAVFDRAMPPWHAEAPVGTFANDRSLTPEQIATIVAWVDQGAPEGDAVDLPEPQVPRGDLWRAATPDLVYWIPETYILPAATLDEHRCFVIPDTVEHDLWYSGLEIAPGNAAVVHHVVVFADPAGASLELDRADSQPGFVCDMQNTGSLRILDAWTPGGMVEMARPGIASKIAAGTTLVYQVHYHNTTGADQPDRSGFGLHLARATVHKEPAIAVISAWPLDIKAGDPAAEHHQEWTAPEDLHVLIVMPHMHFLGKDMKVTARLPGGAERLLLDVPRYDFYWQTRYVYREPIAIPKGTVLHMVSHHDNTAANAYNPWSPPRDVGYGYATHEEMAIAIVLFTLDDQQLGIEPALPEAMIRKNQERELARQAEIAAVANGDVR